MRRKSFPQSRFQAFKSFRSASHCDGECDATNRCDGGVTSFTIGGTSESNLCFNDPSRIICLEWRKVRRAQHHGLISHSWLEAHLLDGRRLRLELFADGISEITLANGRTDPQSVLYKDRAAAAHELAKALAAADLREVATKIASSQPYCLIKFNCHHFVRDVWNTVVITALHRRHHPDRIKTNMMWGFESTIGSWFSNLASLNSMNSNLAVGARCQVEADVSEEAKPPLARGRAGEPEDGRRFWGDIAAVPRASPRYNQAERLQRFGFALATGIVKLLEEKGDLLQMTLPSVLWDDDVSSNKKDQEPPSSPASKDTDVPLEEDEPIDPALQKSKVSSDSNSDSGNSSSSSSSASFLSEDENEEYRTWASRSREDPSTRQCEAWATQWLPKRLFAAMRLAEHMGTGDTVEMVARILKPSTDAASAAHAGSRSLSSLRSQRNAAPNIQLQNESVTDVCYVVLSGKKELRLAIYALLRQDTQVWRLRLLSGDACAGLETVFKYTLQNIEVARAPASAEAMAKSEAKSLQFALATGDWSFITLM